MRVTVGFSAKGDGTKLKPIIVFKGTIRKVQLLQKVFQGKCLIASTKNGWMDTNLKITWSNTVLGQLCFRRRLLSWDTYKCHLQLSVQASLKPKRKFYQLYFLECVPNIYQPLICVGTNPSKIFASNIIMNSLKQKESKTRPHLEICDLHHAKSLLSGSWIHGKICPLSSFETHLHHVV